MAFFEGWYTQSGKENDGFLTVFETGLLGLSRPLVPTIEFCVIPYPTGTGSKDAKMVSGQMP